MNNASLFAILIGGLLVNNFVLSQFLGICPFLGVSKKLNSAVGMSLSFGFGSLKIGKEKRDEQKNFPKSRHVRGL